MNEHHYSRIDAGQPRPDYPPSSPRDLSVAKRPLQDLPIARRAEIAAEVLARYLHGEQVAAMALDYDTSDVTLYALLLRDHEDEWKDAQTARALARLERAQQGLIDALNPLSLARERELVRSAQWELERVLHRIYGQKQEVTHNIQQPILNITVVQMTVQAPVDNSVVATQLPHGTMEDNIHKLP